MQRSSNPRRYIFVFDSNLGDFIRSGKVNGRGFGVRHAEHKKCASDALSSSFFYLVFPLKNSIRASKRDRRGIFESLEQVVAAGFDSKSETAKHVN